MPATLPDSTLPNPSPITQVSKHKLTYTCPSQINGLTHNLRYVKRTSLPLSWSGSSPFPRPGPGLFGPTKAEGWGGLLRPNTSGRVSVQTGPFFCADIFFVLLGADHVSIIRTPSPPRVLGNCASWGFTLPPVFWGPRGSALAAVVKGYVAAGRMRQLGWCGPITPPVLDEL